MHGIADLRRQIFGWKGDTPGIFVKAHSPRERRSEEKSAKGLTRHNVRKCGI